MTISLGRGLPTLDECYDELEEYGLDLSRYYDPDVPIGNLLDLLEVATAYLARALEMERLLHQREQINSLPRGCPEQRFRTGALRSFIAQASALRDLGSRRLSYSQHRYESERTGRE